MESFEELSLPEFLGKALKQMKELKIKTLKVGTT